MTIENNTTDNVGVVNRQSISAELLGASEVEHVLEETWPDKHQRQIARAALERVARASARFMVAHKDTFIESATIAENPANDDGDFLSSLMTQLLEPEPFVSDKALLYLQGAQRFRAMINNAGGTYKQDEVATLLEITESGVRKRMERGKLLAIMVGGKHRYPVWQFDKDRGEVYPVFIEVLNLLNTTSNNAKVRFFLTPMSQEAGTPIEAIAENRDLDLVRLRAKQFGHHGAT